MPRNDVGMDTDPRESDAQDIRELFLDMTELLEAIVIALQADRGNVDTGFVLREAVRRVVRLRERLNDAGFD